MNKCKIETWTFDEEQSADGCFLFYRLTGQHQDGPFDVTVGIEIDGRDGEYQQHSGVDMNFASDDQAARDRWDDLLQAFDEAEGLEEDMANRS